MKRYSGLALVLILSLLACAALADGAPASQFGFKGWPYRQQSGCTTPAVTSPPALAPSQAPSETAVPAATPQPTLMPTLQPTASASPRPTSTADYTTESSTAQEQKAWNLLNQDRAAQGLPALTLDAELSQIARIKAQDMRDNHYFSHTSPTYGNASAMLQAFGYSFNGVGENIAHHATVEKAQAAFMSSTGHRANILGSQWTKIGIGVAVDSNGFVYVTQLFVR